MKWADRGADGPGEEVLGRTRPEKPIEQRGEKAAQNEANRQDRYVEIRPAGSDRHVSCADLRRRRGTR